MCEAKRNVSANHNGRSWKNDVQRSLATYMYEPEENLQIKIKLFYLIPESKRCLR
jgi:hypothetical protein